MSKVLVEESNLSNIGSAIRQKNGSSETYKPSEMATAIINIPTGGSAIIESKSISENGTYTAPSGVDGYSPIVVNVANSYVAGDEGKVVSNGELVAQTTHSEVTQNGTIDTTLNNSVTVNVSGGGGDSNVIGFDKVTFLNTSTDTGIGDATSGWITTDITSPSRGGTAPSGAEQIIYTSSPVDLTDINAIIFMFLSSSRETFDSAYCTITGNPVNNYSEYASSIAYKNVTVYGGGSYVFSFEVSNLSGLYYLSYVTKLSYNTYGWCRARFKMVLL